MADEQTVAVPVEGATEDEKTSSKKGAKKQQKEAEKAKRKAETAAKLQAEAAQRDSDDCSVGNYGNLPLIQSTEQSGRLWTNLVDVSEAQVGKTVLIRARLHTSRGTGKLCFLVLRQQYHTIQAVVAVGDKVSKQMVKFAADVHLESIVDVEGTIASTSERILGCSHQTVELRVTKL
ncbi:hypothetical protein EMCRGX_G006378 [Ephydatia muelleri]